MNTRSDEKNTGKDAPDNKHSNRIGLFPTVKQSNASDNQPTKDVPAIDNQISNYMKLFALKPISNQGQFYEYDLAGSDIDPAILSPRLSQTLSDEDY